MRYLASRARAPNSNHPIHSLSTDEWMAAIQFLTRVGQAGESPLCMEMASLFFVLGVSGLVERINNPVWENATETSFLGPFYAEDAEHSKCRRSYTARSHQALFPGSTMWNTVMGPGATAMGGCIPRKTKTAALSIVPSFPTRMRFHATCVLSIPLTYPNDVGF